MTQELQYDKSNGNHVLEAFPDNVDVGTYVFVFEVPACLVNIFPFSCIKVYLYQPVNYFKPVL